MINIVSTKEKEEDLGTNDSMNDDQRNDRIMSFDLLNNTEMNISLSDSKKDEVKIIEVH